jgi:hypothetical protein
MLHLKIIIITNEKSYEDRVTLLSKSLNFEISIFFEQKFCKTQISKLGMAITLTDCKLGSNTWCNFVRIGVLHMISYLKFEIFEIS